MTAVKRYSVELTETMSYTVEVAAESMDAAATIAREMWAQSDDPIHDYCGSGDGVEVITVHIFKE